ncbi:MAG TPA: Hsp20/alpha crystallin family protein [Bacteroidales bacterium]|nr:Hsp20/alpha crystallin family protein [Bacteroidales bacterium]
MTTTIRKFQNHWFPSLFNDMFDKEFTVSAPICTPAVNVIEDEKSYRIEMTAPGMTKKDFSIRLDENDVLVVEMKKTTVKKEEDKKLNYLRREFAYTEFKRSYYLPEDVDKKNIKASMENGVLNIELHKKTEAQKASEVKRIEIS